MKKRRAAYIAAAVLIAMLTACGKKEMAPGEGPAAGIDASAPSSQVQIGEHGENGTQLQQLIARNLQHQLALEVPSEQVESKWLAIRAECLRLGCLLEEASYRRFDADGYNGEASISARLPHEQVEPYFAFLRKQGVLVKQHTAQASRRQEIAQLGQDVRDSAKTGQDASAGKSATLRQGLAAVARMQAEQAAISAALLNTQPVSVELSPEPAGWGQRAFQTLGQSAGGLLNLSCVLLPFVAAGLALWYALRRFGRTRRAKISDNRKIESNDSRES